MPAPGRRLTQADLDKQVQGRTEEEFDQRIEWVLAEMQRLGYPVKVISKKRTAQQQADLYAQGRTKKGNIVTEKSGAPGEESLHQTGQAVDFMFTGKSKPWDVLGEVAKKYGLGWGGDWTSLVDRPHVQLERRKPVPFQAGSQARGYTDPASVQTTAGVTPPPRIGPPSPEVSVAAAQAPTTLAKRQTGPTFLPLSAVPAQASASPEPRPAPMQARGYTDPASVRVTPTAGPQPPSGRPAPMEARGSTDPASVKVTPAPGAEPPRQATWPDIIAGIAEQEGVNPSLAVAIAEQENEPFDPSAISPAGAIGLMQVKPATAAKYKLDPNDPIQNIMAGVQELKYLTGKYGSNLDRAMAAYNLGENAVDVGEGVPEAAHEYLYGSETRPMGALGRIGKYADIRSPRQPAQAPATEGPKIGPAPGPAWQAVRETIPATGAMLGQIGGAILGAPAAIVNPYLGAATITVGNVGGAYGGGAGGESIVVALEMLGQKLGLFPEGYKPPTTEGALNRIGSAGQTAAEGSLFGKALEAGAPVAAKVLAPFKNSLQPWYSEARVLMKDKVILPAQVTTSRVLRWIANAAEGSVLSGPKPAQARAGQQVQGEKAVSELLSQLGPETTAEAAGQSVQQRLPPSAKIVAQQQAVQANEAAELRRNLAAAELRATQGVAHAAEEAAELRRKVAAAELRSAQGAARAGAEARTADEAARAQGLEGTASELQTGLGGAIEPGPAGAAVQAGREAAVQEFRALEKVAWGAYEDEAKNIVVTETPLLTGFIERVTGRSKGTFLPNAGTTAARHVASLVGEGQEGLVRIGGGAPVPITSLAENLQQAIMASAETVGEPMTAVELARTVSDIGTLSRALTTSAKMDPSKFSKQAGLAKELYRVARLELTNTLGTLKDSEARRLYEVATSTTKAGQRRLFNKTMLQLAQADPDKLVGRLLTKNNATAVRMVTKAVGDAYMDPLRASAFQSLIVRDAETQAVNPAGTIRKMANIGDETLRAMFPGGEHTQLRSVMTNIFEAERLAGQAQQAEARALATAQQGMATTREANRQAQREAAQVVTRAEEGVSATAALNRQSTRANAANVRNAQQDLFDPLRNEAQTAQVLAHLLKKDNAAMIRGVRQTVGDVAFEPTQRVMLDRLVARDAKTQAINWGETLENLKPGKYDQESLDAFFPNGHAETLRNIADKMWKLEQQQPGSRLPLWITDAGFVYLRGGPFPKTTAAIRLSFPMMARVMASKTGAKWLSEGLEAPVYSAQARQAAGQLVAFMMRDPDYEKAAAEERTPKSPVMRSLERTAPTR